MMRKRHFAAFTLFLGILFLGNTAFSQESIGSEQINDNWTLLTSKDGVDIFIKKEKVDVGAEKKFDYAQVKMVNTTGTSKTIEFNFEMHHELTCVGCGSTNEYEKSITIEGGSSLEGDAAFTNPELSLLINNPYQTGVGAIQSIKLVQLSIK